MALDIYNTPAGMPSGQMPEGMPGDGQPMPDGLPSGQMPEGMPSGQMPEGMPPEMAGVGEQMPAPYIQGGANGSFGGRQQDHQKLIEWISHPNIATELSDEENNAIGSRVRREFDIDLGTRSDWEAQAELYMDLAMQVAKEKTHPWPKASNIIFPLMTTAAVQFAARAYPAIVQGRNIVKGVVVGPDTGQPQISPQDGTPMVQMTQQGPQPVWAMEPGAKRARADRIGEHMSWQLLEEMTEWEEETDKLLHILPIIGCAFRKSFYDRGRGRNASMLAMPLNVVINFWAKDMERAPRISELLKFYPQEIEEFVRAKLFVEHKYGIAVDANGDDDAPHEFIEQHRLLDLDDDGYAEPYVVTLHKQTSKVARIVARYDAEGVQINRQSGEVVRIEPVHYYTKYDFLPNPKGGIYGVGFGQLLGPINAAVNTTLNMMFDAEHLKITGGGFIGRGLSMHAGSVKFKPNEWKVLNVPGETVRNSIVPLPAPGASAVMFSLLGMLVEAGKEVASVKDALTGETAAATMQPTTLLALIEQGLKVFTAIYKRIHRSAKKEYDKLYRLNRIYLEQQARYRVGDEWKTVTREDYAKSAGVTPVSDPVMVSDMQRMARAQLLQSYQNDPLCDGVEIRKQIFSAAQIEGADKIIHGQMPPNPQMLAKTAELELKKHDAEARIATERARQVNMYAQAVNYLASATKTDASHNLDWAEHQLDVLRLRMEAANGWATDQQAQGGEGEGGEGEQGGPGPQGGPPSAEGAGPPGLTPPAPMPGMNAGAEPWPGNGMDEAPFQGARRAPDGHWYIGDPGRPGKFMRVAGGG